MTKWSDYKGQTNAVKYVRNCINKNIFPKALLITGPPGVGKSLLSELTIRSIICANDNDKPCGVCEYCKTDYKELSNVRWNQITNITGMTDYLTDTALWAKEAPIYLNDIGITRKFVVLDEIQLLTTNYIQSLLGYIDSSPSTTTWIFISMDLSRLSNTDLEALSSRCSNLNLYQHSSDDCIKYIIDTWNLSYSNAKLLADLSDGNMRKIGAMIEFCNGVDPNLNVADILIGKAKDRTAFWDSLYNKEYTEAMNICNEWLKNTNSQILTKLLIDDLIEQLALQQTESIIHDLDLLIKYTTNTIKVSLSSYITLLNGFKKILLSNKNLSFYSLKELEDYYVEYYT